MSVAITTLTATAAAVNVPLQKRYTAGASSNRTTFRRHRPHTARIQLRASNQAATGRTHSIAQRKHIDLEARPSLQNFRSVAMAEARKRDGMPAASPDMIGGIVGQEVITGSTYTGPFGLACFDGVVGLPGAR
jgi:hypothetical protein